MNKLQRAIAIQRIRKQTCPTCDGKCQYWNRDDRVEFWEISNLKDATCQFYFPKEERK